MKKTKKMHKNKEQYMSHGDIQHTSIHNDTSIVKESNMVNYDGILLELWKKKGQDEQIDELIHFVLTEQYTEKYKEVGPIWKDIENLQLSAGQILEAWKNMEKEGIERVNKENIAIALARQITALQHKPLK